MRVNELPMLKHCSIVEVDELFQRSIHHGSLYGDGTDSTTVRRDHLSRYEPGSLGETTSNNALSPNNSFGQRCSRNFISCVSLVAGDIRSKNFLMSASALCDRNSRADYSKTQ
jgi:hypothetical protein